MGRLVGKSCLGCKRGAQSGKQEPTCGRILPECPNLEKDKIFWGLCVVCRACKEKVFFIFLKKARSSVDSIVVSP